MPAFHYGVSFYLQASRGGPVENLYIVWSADNRIGIPIIDEQHRGIVSTINTFHYFVQRGQGLEVVVPILESLKLLTELHFQTEERLMELAQYPQFSEHRLGHRRLLQKTALIQDEATQQDDPYIALKFLRDWWLTHINTIDRDYTPFVYSLMNSYPTNR